MTVSRQRRGEREHTEVQRRRSQETVHSRGSRRIASALCSRISASRWQAALDSQAGKRQQRIPRDRQPSSPRHRGIPPCALLSAALLCRNAGKNAHHPARHSRPYDNIVTLNISNRGFGVWRADKKTRAGNTDNVADFPLMRRLATDNTRVITYEGISDCFIFAVEKGNKRQRARTREGETRNVAFTGCLPPSLPLRRHLSRTVAFVFCPHTYGGG